MKIQVLTPTGKVFEGEGTAVSVPGAGGAFEILDNHAPIVSSLDAGTVKVTLKEGGRQEYQIKSGFVEVLRNDVALLVTMG